MHTLENPSNLLSFLNLDRHHRVSAHSSGSTSPRRYLTRPTKPFSQPPDWPPSRRLELKHTPLQDSMVLNREMNFPVDERWDNMPETSDDTTRQDTNVPTEATTTAQTNAEKVSKSYATRKLETEQTLKEQTEDTRSWLLAAAESSEIDELSQDFARTSALIIHYWQNSANGENPTSHPIDFGTGVKVNLLYVLAILPERYQHAITIEDKGRSPFNNGDALSWLHEDTMNLLVGLFVAQKSFRIFGQGLASMVSDDIDNSWRHWYGQSYLEHQTDRMSKNELSESELDLYRYPHWTETIVFFFNPTGVHWTLVEVDLSDDRWTYTLYNSLSNGKRGPTWKACKRQLPLLEHLICRASGFQEPESRDFMVGTSAQQGNSYDCGPIAVYNAIGLLKGQMPRETVDAEHLRLWYLKKILSSLQKSSDLNSVYWELDSLQRAFNSESLYWDSTVK